VTPEIRRRLRALALRADTEDGLDRLCEYVNAYANRPVKLAAPLQPDGTTAFAATVNTCDPARCSVWTRMMRRFA